MYFGQRVLSVNLAVGRVYRYMGTLAIAHIRVPPEFTVRTNLVGWVVARRTPHPAYDLRAHNILRSRAVDLFFVLRLRCVLLSLLNNAARILLVLPQLPFAFFHNDMIRPDS